MKLGLKERLELISLLPTEDNMLTLAIANDIKKKVELTQIDIDKYQIKVENNSFMWNEEGIAAVFDISFTELELKVLKDKIKELDSQKKIPIAKYDLCLKINKE